MEHTVFFHPLLRQSRPHRLLPCKKRQSAS
ncbi:rCG50108 [Rattus norvegicus]|uniref:RCG50108 n=1 Tax=Rattus norvegicus TaxID=10116 RepID=A6JVN4_RAT|nr:rCG50108 [Rattus norvegicus]